MKLDRAPPATVTSEAVNVVEASLNVKVSVVVTPAMRLLLAELKAIVGTTLSTAKVMVLFVSDPSALRFPAVSVKTPLATLTVPLAVLLAVGVNSAVYVVPLPLKLESVPPTTVKSPTVKLEDDSLKVKVMVAVCEAERLVEVVMTAMLGGVVSAGMVKVKEILLFASAPSSLKIPRASENLPLPTLTLAPFAPSILAVNKAE